MNRRRSIFYSALSLLLAALPAWGAAQGNPYQTIIERNAFALKPPPAAPDPALSKPPPPKIVLQGIISILGKWQVLGKYQTPAKPGEPAKETSFILSAGQRDGEVEVLSIDGKAGMVRFMNNGQEQELSMDKDAVKQPAGAPPAAPPVNMPAVVPPAPASPGGAFGGSAGGGIRTIPTRTLRLPNASSTSQTAMPGAGGGGGVPLGGPGSGVSANSGTFTVPGGVIPEGTTPSQQDLVTRSVEENVLLYEANRLRNQDAVRAGRLPPMPPHPLAVKNGLVDGQGSPAGQPSDQTQPLPQ